MATKDYLGWDQTLFRDQDVFEIDFVPDQLHHRDRQLRELAFHVRPALRGGRPLNAICKGLPGTGKTTCVKKLFADIEETTRTLVPVFVNCQVERTRAKVFAKVYEQLVGHAPQTTGVPQRKVLAAIARHMLDERRVVVVCLDDINYLQDAETLNGVLYTLIRTHEEYPGTRMGVIATLSDVHRDLKAELDACVTSVFQPAEIYFDPYTAGEMQGILKERAVQGLYPGVLSAEMLDFVVTQTMRCGDLRVGLDLIKRSVLLAETAGRKEVCREDVCAAYEHSRYVHLACTVKTLNAAEKRLLRHIAEMTREDVGLTSGEVFRSAKERMKLSYSNFFDRLKKLDELRLIDMQHRNEGGRTRDIVLRYEAEKVVAVCG